MNILAIRMARFGDVVLLLPALKALKSCFPGSRLTFLTGHRCAPIAEMCPALDDIISLDRIAMRDGPKSQAIVEVGRLLKDIRRRDFDLVVDFHGFRETNLIAWLSGADRRLGLKRFDRSYLDFCFNLPPVLEDKSIHVSDMFMRVVERFGSGANTDRRAMAVPETAREWAREVLPANPIVTLYIDAPVPERIWPAERFAEVADHVSRHWGASVVAVSGLQGAPLLGRLIGNAQQSAEVMAFSNLTIPQLAAVIDRSDLLVSNDTGPMHLGPALGVATLGLFSVGIPAHFRPTGANDRFVLGNPLETVQTRDVIGMVDEMLAIVRPDLRR